MLFIPCTTDCRYQQDGCCKLDTAGSLQKLNHAAYSKCPYYVNRSDAFLLPGKNEMTRPQSYL